MDKNQATCVNPELDLLVPPRNSTIVQDVGNTSVSDLFTQICDGTRKLIELLPSISNTVQEVKEAEKHVQSVIVSVRTFSDPEVIDKLVDLQKEFRDFIRVGKDFLENCLSMAKYATDEQHLTEIKEQLKRKILNKLKVYIDSLSGYLQDCDESFEEFRTAHDKIDDQVYTAKKHLFDQHKEAKKEASDAVKKYKTDFGERKRIESLTTALGMVSSACAVAGAEGIITPEVAVFHSLVGYIEAYLAYTTDEGTAVLDVMKQERAREEMLTKEKILLDALNCVVSLQQSVLNAAALSTDLKSHLDRASKAIEGRWGLKDVADSNKEDIDFQDLTNKLDMLQRATGEIVKVIGEDGITPISSWSNLLTGV